MLKTIDPAKNAISTIKRLIATGDDIIIYRLVLVPSLAILVSMKIKESMEYIYSILNSVL